MPLSLLDGPVGKIEAAIPSLSIGEIELLLDAERGGKTRKGAIALLEAALAAAERPQGDESEPEATHTACEPESAPAAVLVAGFEEVENIVSGSDITLHDGSHLLFGEKAVVPAQLAVFMRERGQVA